MLVSVLRSIFSSLQPHHLSNRHPSRWIGASHLEQAIDLRQDHVLLGVQRYQPGYPALRIDWPMYQALVAAQEGLPIALQPFHILRRLDLFLRSLGQNVGGPRDTEMIEWSTQRRGINTTPVRISRSRRTYE